MPTFLELVKNPKITAKELNDFLVCGMLGKCPGARYGGDWIVQLGELETETMRERFKNKRKKAQEYRGLIIGLKKIGFKAKMIKRLTALFNLRENSLIKIKPREFSFDEIIALTKLSFNFVDLFATAIGLKPACITSVKDTGVAETVFKKYGLYHEYYYHRLNKTTGAIVSYSKALVKELRRIYEEQQKAVTTFEETDAQLGIVYGYPLKQVQNYVRSTEKVTLECTVTPQKSLRFGAIKTNYAKFGAKPVMIFGRKQR